MHGTDSGACASPSCTVGSTRCSEDAIETCSDGFGFEQTLGPCASEALCELTRGQTNATQCASPACNAGNARCRDGAVESCSSDLTGYDSSKCPTEQPRCNPSAGQCISLDVDATEVTQGEYAAFLGSVNKPELPPACAFKSNFAPDSSCVATVANCTSSDCTKLPQSCVDWCDAWAYCTAAGKHLCGRIGGGILPFDSFADPGVSEWSNACTSGGEYAFPYGDSEVNKDCKGAVNQPNQTIAVGSLASCQSPVVAYAGLFDLSGNIAEWDDSCAKAATGSGAGASDECHVRGGSYLAENAELACAASRTLLRSQTSPEVGFRCCGAGQ
jgi:formylglycine-generating enzyme required for sulfatase activity